MRNLAPKRIIKLNMWRLLVIPSAAITVGAILLLAQEPAKQAAPSTDQPFNITPLVVQAVQAPVTVLDRDGRLVSGLTALDFKLFDNKKEQMIVQDLSEHPISVVVAIQANAGMEKILPQIR